MDMENSWIDFTLTRGPIRGKERNRVGLIIKVKARPDLEEFMKGLAQGQKLPLDAIGDTWQNFNQDGKPLEFYQMDNHRFESNRIYSVDAVGQAPLIADGRNARNALSIATDDVVNLSFLRLVGISNENGVTVGIPGAYSGDYIRRLRGLLPTAVKLFLQDYVVPITINLQVISKG